MKTLGLLIITILFCFSLFGCEQSTKSNQESVPETKASSKIKLLGNIIPRPSMKYDVIISSDESVSLEVNNATEDDFRAYVDTCRPYGFDGEIKSATSPDLYYSEYNEDEYFLQIFFYEEEQKFSVYIRIPSKSDSK